MGNKGMRRFEMMFEGESMSESYERQRYSLDERETIIQPAIPS